MRLKRVETTYVEMLRRGDVIPPPEEVILCMRMWHPRIFQRPVVLDGFGYLFSLYL
jgi:hypothetical protein